MTARGLTASELMAVYSEAMNDPAQRARLDEVLAPEFVFEGPVFAAYGLAEFRRELGSWVEQLPPSARLVVEPDVPEHHARFLARYAYVSDGGDLGSGWAFGERRPDGMIARLTGFVDPGSDLPHQGGAAQPP